MRIALVSMNQVWRDKSQNLAQSLKYAHLAADKKCDLVIFPEMTLTGYSLDVAGIAEPIHDSPTLKNFGEIAAAAKLDVIFGACLVDTESRHPRNMLCQAKADGEVYSIYSKIHPFSFVGEENFLQRGDALSCAVVGELRLGCSICYDLRFPEPFSVLAATCNAFVNIANWPASRISHWKTLLAARAIENQLIVLGVNRIGVDGNGLSYAKSSMAISPDGTILCPIYSEAEMDIYEIDVEDTDKYRKSFPTLKDKRYSFYKTLYNAL